MSDAPQSSENSAAGHQEPTWFPPEQAACPPASPRPGASERHPFPGRTPQYPARGQIAKPLQWGPKTAELSCPGLGNVQSPASPRRAENWAPVSGRPLPARPRCRYLPRPPRQRASIRRGPRRRTGPNPARPVERGPDPPLMRRADPGTSSETGYHDSPPVTWNRPTAEPRRSSQERAPAGAGGEPERCDRLRRVPRREPRGYPTGASSGDHSGGREVSEEAERVRLRG
jgi:hypothetical protein